MAVFLYRPRGSRCLFGRMGSRHSEHCTPKEFKPTDLPSSISQGYLNPSTPPPISLFFLRPRYQLPILNPSLFLKTSSLLYFLSTSLTKAIFDHQTALKTLAFHHSLRFCHPAVCVSILRLVFSTDVSHLAPRLLPIFASVSSQASAPAPARVSTFANLLSSLADFSFCR